MKLSDLKTGMRVTLRDGREGYIALTYNGVGSIIVLELEGKQSYVRLSKYDNEDFEHFDEYYYDIMKVEDVDRPVAFQSVLNKNFSNIYVSYKTIYKRQAKEIEMTVEDIEYILGIEKLKIVKRDNTNKGEK